MARTERMEKFFSGEPVSLLCVRFACVSRRHVYTGNRTPTLEIGFQWFHVLHGERMEKVSGFQNAFTGVQTNNYWSSTTNADNTSNAWNVNLNNGNVNNNDKTNSYYVWPVRGGE